MKLHERTVATCLASYFAQRGLETIGKFNVFDHVDDAQERTFVVDYAIGPIATKGIRTPREAARDRAKFEEQSSELDMAVEALMEASIFPITEDRNGGWNWRPNPNPMVGIAIEVENARSKYFLGSLLAASATGRWGLLIVPDTRETEKWVGTVRRMVLKGADSPIPSNITIFTWPGIRSKVEALITQPQ